jgi:hypothetical protein
VAGVRSTRVLVGRLVVGRLEVALGYGELFVVVREGQLGPGPNDWELSVQGQDEQRLTGGRHHLRIELPDGSEVSGDALLRFTDGCRHLFRGDGPLAGWRDDPAHPIS